MKSIQLKKIHRNHPVLLGLLVFATMATLMVFTARTEAYRADASGCPYLAQASAAKCPYMAAAKSSGCPHMAAEKGSGCPYLKEAKGCLHALKYSLEMEEDQLERVRAIQGKFLEESSAMKTEIRETSADLDRLFRDPEATADDILAKRKALEDVKSRFEEMAMDARMKIRGELSEEQLRQIPEGCWHGLLAYGYGGTYGYGCHHGCTCPYMKGHPDVSA